MTNKDREDKLLEIRRESEASLPYFVSTILDFPPLHQCHQDAMAFLSDDSSRRKRLFMPRGTYKTYLSLAWLLWMVIKNPEERCLIACDTTDVAYKRLKVLKTWMETSEWLRGLWPEIFWNDPQSQAPVWSEKGAAVRRKGNWTEETFEPGGADVNIVGRHYTIGLLDDIVTRDTMESDKKIRRCVEYYQLLRPIYVAKGSDGGGYREVLEGTRWGHNDPYGWIIEKEPEIRTHSRGIWLNEEKTETIMGDDLTPKMLEEIARTMSASQFAALMLNDPVSEKGAFFKREDIEPFAYDVLPVGTYFCTVTMDPASKAKSTSDRTAISCRLVDNSGHWWMEKEWAGRLELAGRAMQLYSFCADLEDRGLRPMKVGIEDPDGVDINAFRDEMNRNRKWWPVREIKHRGRTKESRVTTIQALIEQHRVHFRSEQRDTMMETFKFPTGRYDDRIEAVSMHKDPEMEVGSPGESRKEIPFNSPDAIAERHKRRHMAQDDPTVGFQYDSASPLVRVEESWYA